MCQSETSSPGIHGLVVGRDEVDALAVLGVHRVQVDPASSAPCDQHDDLLVARRRRPRRWASARPARRTGTMSGCMKAIRSRPPEMPMRHRPVGLETRASPWRRPPAVPPAGGRWRPPARPAGPPRSRGPPRRPPAPPANKPAGRRQHAFQQGQVHRPGHVRAEQVVLGVGRRGGDRADVAAVAADRLDDVGQVVLPLGVGVGQVLRDAACSVAARMA